MRVANELGLRHPRAARLSVIVALVTALFIGLLISIILFIERSRYPALFSSSPEIQKLVEQLTPSLGLCIVLTCLQGPLYGTLRLSITSSTENICFWTSWWCRNSNGSRVAKVHRAPKFASLLDLWHSIRSSHVLQVSYGRQGKFRSSVKSCVIFKCYKRPWVRAFFVYK